MLDLFYTDDESPELRLASLIRSGDSSGAVRWLDGLGNRREMEIALLKCGFSVVTTRTKKDVFTHVGAKLLQACAMKKTPLDMRRQQD